MNSANPSDLRDCPWFPADSKGNRHYPDGTPVGYAHGFWIPKFREQGLAGAYHQVALDIAKGWTLRQLISSWAPPSENDTEAYIAHVSAWTGIPDDGTALWMYMEVKDYRPDPVFPKQIT